MVIKAITGNLNDDEKKYSVYQFKKKVGGKSQYYGDKKYGKDIKET